MHGTVGIFAFSSSPIPFSHPHTSHPHTHHTLTHHTLTHITHTHTATLPSQVCWFLKATSTTRGAASDPTNQKTAMKETLKSRQSLLQKAIPSIYITAYIKRSFVLYYTRISYILAYLDNNRNGFGMRELFALADHLIRNSSKLVWFIMYIGVYHILYNTLYDLHNSYCVFMIYIMCVSTVSLPVHFGILTWDQSESTSNVFPSL